MPRPLKGRKAIVVFSNGPDNASSVPPEDVAELAQSTGTIIYIISTRQAQEDPVSAAAFERMSKVSGGKAYFAKNWREEKQAFASIREDLVHLYTLSYYPQAQPQPRLALHQGEAGRQGPAEISPSHARRIPAAARVGAARRRIYFARQRDRFEVIRVRPAKSRCAPSSVPHPCEFRCPRATGLRRWVIVARWDGIALKVRNHAPESRAPMRRSASPAWSALCRKRSR